MGAAVGGGQDCRRIWLLSKIYLYTQVILRSLPYVY